ncbi:hypothetical protein IAU59_007618 [Kwoniella sp. CBS 9459]
MERRFFSLLVDFDHFLDNVFVSDAAKTPQHFKAYSYTTAIELAHPGTDIWDVTEAYHVPPYLCHHLFPHLRVARLHVPPNGGLRPDADIIALLRPAVLEIYDNRADTTGEDQCINWAAVNYNRGNGWGRRILRTADHIRYSQVQYSIPCNNTWFEGVINSITISFISPWQRPHNCRLCQLQLLVQRIRDIDTIIATMSATAFFPKFIFVDLFCGLTQYPFNLPVDTALAHHPVEQMAQYLRSLTITATQKIDRLPEDSSVADLPGFRSRITEAVTFSFPSDSIAGYHD